MKSRLCVFLGIVRWCVTVLYSVRESKVISKFTLGRHILWNVYWSFQIYLSNQHCVGWCQDFWSPIHIQRSLTPQSLENFNIFRGPCFWQLLDRIPLLRSNWTVKTCEFTEISKLFGNLAKYDVNWAPKILATSPDAMLIGQIYLKRTVNISENVST